MDLFKAFLLIMTLIALTFNAATAAETQWLQWGGPNGDFSVSGDGLAKAWPSEGPKQLWSRPLGDGYSSITTDGGTLYTMYWEAQLNPNDDETVKRNGKEVVIALDAATGKTKWEHKYDVNWAKDAGMDLTFGPGPNSTPLIVGDRLFTVGATVKLHCLDRNTGKVIWQQDLKEKYGASTIQYGYGATPLPYEETIILPIGGKDQGLVCLKMSDGSEVWKKQTFSPCWVTPLLINLEGQDQLIVGANKGVAGICPRTGELIWQVEGHQGSYISTPVWGDDNVLFVSAAYGVGARGIKLTREGEKTKAEELWHNRKVKFMHCTGVRDGDIVFGSSGDFGPTLITATNMKTGELLWRKRGFSKANCLKIGKQLIILDEDGNLALTTPHKDKLEIHNKVKVAERQSWTCPTISGKRMFLRDRKTIQAFDIGA